MFRDVVKAVCKVTLSNRQELPLAESLVKTDTGRLNDDKAEPESQVLTLGARLRSSYK